MKSNLDAHKNWTAFVQLYQTKSIIEYSKIEFINGRILDNFYFWHNKLEELHYIIMENIFKWKIDFELTRINIFATNQWKIGNMSLTCRVVSMKQYRNISFTTILKISQCSIPTKHSLSKIIDNYLSSKY